MDKTQQIITRSVMKILRPLARILLKNGVSYGVFTDLARKAFVTVATDDYGTRGRKASVSKVAILTGLSRKAVKQLRDIYLNMAEVTP